MYRYEIHLHSSGCSACATSTATEMVDAAKECGYTGVVFTNHFYHGNTCIDCDLEWTDFCERYRADYLTALEYGKKLDIDVLFGLEEGYGYGKEALIYGLSPEDIASQPQIKNMDISELSSFVRSHGGFIAAAHPFRRRFYITDPDREPCMDFFDAIEVHNKFNTDEDNETALKFAKKVNANVISGGDIHNKRDFGTSGLAFTERLWNNKGLIKALKNRSYKLIINGEITDLPF